MVGCGRVVGRAWVGWWVVGWAEYEWGVGRVW